jgi:hypothetical protein
MPRAKLSDVSLKQLVAELERRKSRLADLLARREAIRKAIAQHDAIEREITELQMLGFSSDVEQATPVAARRGRPPGKRNVTLAALQESGRTLADYVRNALASATKGMSVSEIEKRILASEYPTKAKRLYKQVMAVLGKGGFQKVERGVYQLAGAARQAGQAAMTAAAKAVTPTPATGKAQGKRGVFPQTGEQFILGLVKGKGATTGQINQKWSASGRKGKADVTLARMFKAGKVNREKLEGKKGSNYTAS